MTRSYTYFETLTLLNSKPSVLWRLTSAILDGHHRSKHSVFTGEEKKDSISRVAAVPDTVAVGKKLFSTLNMLTLHLSALPSNLFCFQIYLLLLLYYLEFSPPKQTGSLPQTTMMRFILLNILEIAFIAVRLIRSGGIVCLQQFTD